MSDTNHGIRLADGTFIQGSLGQSGNQIELIITNEEAAAHLLDLMNPEKTKEIKFYVDFLAGTYTDFVFAYMQQDSLAGKVNVWLKKKGEI